MLKNFNDFNNFVKFSGMLTTEYVKEKYSNKLPEIEHNYNGYALYDIKDLNKLQSFINKNSQYHIMTLTSDLDDIKNCSLTIDNSIRKTNRLGFFLGNLSKNDAFLAELNEDGTR